MRHARLLLCLSWICGSALVQAQPRGPADVIGGARKAREAREMKAAGERGTKTEPAEAAPAAQPEPGAQPVQPGDEQAGDEQPAAAAGPGQPAGHGGSDDAQQAPRIADERPNPALPGGTIRVHVVDPQGRAIAGADVELATMLSDNSRSARSLKTGADGSVSIPGLATGDKQAYRVNVLYDGAKYSSSPFRLPLTGGYEVEIRRLPVTRSDRMVVTYVGATSVELKDDRMRVVQQTRLMNVGRETYVFPEEGTLLRLPEGFMAFQTQDVMTDQHVVEAKGEGLRVRGSLPPGEATLLWAFDLPLSGSEASFGIDLPWLVFTYRVITDAPDGMKLKVANMPEPETHSDKGRRYWVTEIQRRMGDQPFRRVDIALTGIPGQGSARWFASLLALCAVIGGIVVARKLPDPQAARTGADIEAHKQSVLERARALKQQHEAGETGPQYHSERMAELEDELAELLYEQSELKKRSPSGARAPARAPVRA